MRLLSVLVLAIFTMGPGLRAECLVLCLGSGEQPTRSACHDDAAGEDGAGIDALHDCSAIAPAVVTAVKRGATDSIGSLAAGASSFHVMHVRALTDRLVHAPTRFAPPAALPTPLRI